MDSRIDWRSAFRELITGLTPQSVFRITPVEGKFWVCFVSSDCFVWLDSSGWRGKLSFDGKIEPVFQTRSWSETLREDGDWYVDGKNMKNGLPWTGEEGEAYLRGWNGDSVDLIPVVPRKNSLPDYWFKNRLCHYPMLGTEGHAYVGPWFVFTYGGETWCVDMRIQDVPAPWKFHYEGIPGVFKLNLGTGLHVVTGAWVRGRVHLLLDNFFHDEYFIASWP